ncbi:hypothetical protein K3495_g14728 [Podosphaera aphanis]|nr:hypothetical protein K3495_g14728 [Podosphaera aphanis]
MANVSATNLADIIDEKLNNKEYLKMLLSNKKFDYDLAPIAYTLSTKTETNIIIILQNSLTSFLDDIGWELDQMFSEGKGIQDVESSLRKELLASAIKIKNLEDNLQKWRDQTANLLDQNTTMLDKLDIARSNQVGGFSVRAPHRSTSDPEKFDASEKDSAKRQDQYITWRTRIGLNFAEDSSYFALFGRGCLYPEQGLIRSVVPIPHSTQRMER